MCLFCNVILPDNRVSYGVNAEVPVRGSGSGKPLHSGQANQRLMTRWNDLGKKLKCAECVTCASESSNSEEVRV